MQLCQMKLKQRVRLLDERGGGGGQLKDFPPLLCYDHIFLSEISSKKQLQYWLSYAEAHQPCDIKRTKSFFKLNNVPVRFKVLSLYFKSFSPYVFSLVLKDFPNILFSLHFLICFRHTFIFYLFLYIDSSVQKISRYCSKAACH